MHGRSTSASPLLHDALTMLVPRLGASHSARISTESPLPRTGALLGLRLLKVYKLSTAQGITVRHRRSLNVYITVSV
jgi:hypothetical protein